ncbi:MAG TPA: hydantoinase/oxoprolinase family protein [Candidatus Dormibacteraeota bacterium]|nr:hydantoinase/oxoprolinase family protein [Candidatus Dormibacteraeota bacterium]
MAIRVGVDVGGTFTDFVVLDKVGGLSAFKVPSSGAAPEAAVIEGFRRLLADGRRDVALISHGSTIALNTLLQRTGARVGLIVTRGFRDVLQLRRLRLEGSPGFHVQRPRPLVPRRDIREVGGRLRYDGAEVRPLDESEVVAAAEELVAAGCEAIAVSFLHSYRNPTHERRAVAAIRRRLPEVVVTASSEVWPQQREYERTELTVINAHLAPVLRRYYDRLLGALAELGVGATVLATKSSGGVMTAASAARRPVETLLSGPASGVVAAARLGQAAGFPHLVAFDMGGTSADIGLVVGGAVGITTEATVGEFPVVMPSVDVSSVGAGGGSIAALDPSGLLKVGPRSAGSHPGPVCYGRGGTEPTVTDAYVTLGILGDLLGGEMRLDAEAARHACRRLGDRLGTGPEGAAEAILQVATATMCARLLPLMARRGSDPRECALLAYGGAGPTHAFRLAREAGFRRIVIPPSPGTFCALGCLLADLRADFVSTIYADLDRMPEGRLLRVFGDLRREAEAWVADQRVDVGEVRVWLSADMRQGGQSYEIPVDLPGGLGVGFRERAREAFLAAYERVYGDVDRSARIEIVNARVHVVAATPKPALGWKGGGGGEGRRRLCHAGVELEAAVRPRDGLAPGDRVAGPAVITEYGATTFVPPGAFVEVDGAGNLVGGFDA